MLESSAGVFDTNLFLTLGKYTAKQQENLLTQALCAFFNHSPIFRQDFVSFLRLKRGEVSTRAHDYVAFTQQSSRSRGERICVDMTIRPADLSSALPEFVVEAKLSAPFSQAQAKKYAELVRKSGRKTTLVVITKFGLDTELSRVLSDSTIWITWTELAEIVLESGYRPSLERMLCKEFVDMLKIIDIPMSPALTIGELRKLALVDSFLSGSKENLHQDRLETLSGVMSRLRSHVDSNWSSLTDEGFKTYSRFWAGRDEEPQKSWISAGFFQWRPRKGITERYIGLKLECKSLKMTINFGTNTKGVGWESCDPIEISQGIGRKLLTLPPGKAAEIARPIMLKALTRFQKSRFF